MGIRAMRVCDWTATTRYRATTAGKLVGGTQFNLAKQLSSSRQHYTLHTSFSLPQRSLSLYTLCSVHAALIMIVHPCACLSLTDEAR